MLGIILNQLVLVTFLSTGHTAIIVITANFTEACAWSMYNKFNALLRILR